MGDMLMGEDGADRLDAGARHARRRARQRHADRRHRRRPFIVDPMSGNDVVSDFEATGPAQRSIMSLFATSTPMTSTSGIREAAR